MDYSTLNASQYNVIDRLGVKSYPTNQRRTTDGARAPRYCANPVTKTLALCWFFHKRSFSVSGDITRIYSNMITHRDNSNLSVPCLRAFDDSKVICEVSRWHLCGFVKDNPAKWARAHSRASSSLVCYLHYRLLVRMTNKYDGTSAVFAAVLSLARVLFQWFPTFWTINHLQIPSWITREDDVKML